MVNPSTSCIRLLVANHGCIISLYGLHKIELYQVYKRLDWFKVIATRKYQLRHFSTRSNYTIITCSKSSRRRLKWPINVLNDRLSNVSRGRFKRNSVNLFGFEENVVIMYFAVLLLAIWSINGDARHYNDNHCARCVCEWNMHGTSARTRFNK